MLFNPVGLLRPLYGTDVVLSFGLLGFGSLVQEGRQSDRGQDTDDDDNDQQFDQGETCVIFAVEQVAEEFCLKFGLLS